MKTYKSLAEQKNELVNILNKDQLSNYLFFSAKNNIISMIIFELENYFNLNNLNVRADWNESSNYAPSIPLKLKVKNKDFEESYFRLDRKDNGRSDHLGALFYSLKSVHSSHYSRYKKPSELIQLENIMANNDIEKLFSDLLKKVNYPFDMETTIEDNKIETNKFKPSDIDMLVHMYNVSKKYSIYTLVEFIKDYFEINDIFVQADITDFLNGNDIIHFNIENGSKISVQFKKELIDSVPEKFNNEVYTDSSIYKVDLIKSSTIKTKNFERFIADAKFGQFISEIYSLMNFPFKYNSKSPF